MRDSKIEKVRDLLRLAHGGGATEAEAAAAAAAAARIMIQYEIDEAEVEAADVAGVAPTAEAIEVDILWTGNGQVLQAEWDLTAAVCEHGRVGYYRTRVVDAAGRQRMQMRAYGPPSEIEAARLTYAYLREQILRLTQEAYDERGKPGLAWKFSFDLGCTRRVAARLHEARAAVRQEVRAAASGAALMIVDTRAKTMALAVAAKRKTLGLISGGSSSRAGGNMAGYAAGRAAGNAVDVTRQRGRAKLGGGS